MEETNALNIIKYTLVFALTIFIGLILFYLYEYSTIPEIINSEPITVGYPVKIPIVTTVVEATSSDNVPAKK